MDGTRDAQRRDCDCMLKCSREESTWKNLVQIVRRIILEWMQKK
jgi:hypothetical protein